MPGENFNSNPGSLRHPPRLPGEPTAGADEEAEERAGVSL